MLVTISSFSFGFAVVVETKFFPPLSHPLQKLKDELGNRVIQSVVAIRPKVYGYRAVELPASLLSTPSSRDVVVSEELPPTPPPLTIVEDNVDEPMLSIEESGDGVDELLGATAAVAATPPEVSTTPLVYQDISKAKGISKSTIRREINFDNYQQALDTLDPQRHAVRSIKSVDHTMYLEETLKSSIVVNDSKRWWSSKYQSLAFGNPLAISNGSSSTPALLPPPPPPTSTSDPAE